MPSQISNSTKESILNTLGKVNKAISELKYLQEELNFVLTNEFQEEIPPELDLDKIEFDLEDLGREYPPEVIFIQLRKWAQKYEGEKATPEQRKRVMDLLEECMPGRGDQSDNLRDIMLSFLGSGDIDGIRDEIILACLNDWMVDLDKEILPRETGKDILAIELGNMLGTTMPPRKNDYKRYNVYEKKEE